MQATELEHAPSRPPILHRVLVGLGVIAIAALVVHLIIGLLMTIFYAALVAAVVVAIVWGLKRILW